MLLPKKVMDGFAWSKISALTSRFFFSSGDASLIRIPGIHACRFLNAAFFWWFERNTKTETTILVDLQRHTLMTLMEWEVGIFRVYFGALGALARVAGPVFSIHVPQVASWEHLDNMEPKKSRLQKDLKSHNVVPALINPCLLIWGCSLQE